MKLHRALFIAAFGGSIFAMLTLMGCVSQTVEKTREPGLYGLEGWNEQSVWYSKGSEFGQTSAIDIDGEVGKPLYVRGCGAHTEPKNVGWTASHRVVSGELPPGLKFVDGSSGIEGIPKERGHWITTLELYDIKCGAKSYKNFRQQVRFHITGSGKVVD